MKKIVLASLFYLILIVSNAQDYQCFRSDRTVFFEKNNQYSKSIKFDSIHVVGTDSIMYPFKNIQNVDNIWNCYTPFGPSWIGKYIIIKENGFELFFNKMNDTIKIKTNAYLNESWTVYKLHDSTQITASITQHDTMSIFDVTDSVKTISFQAYDKNMEVIDHDINSKTLKLSKEYGIIQTFNFYLFPQYENIYTGLLAENFQEMNILGITNPTKGIQNLTWLEVHNYQVGDEFHILHAYASSNNFKEYKYIYKYLERTNYGLDSIRYVIDRKYKNTQWIADSVIETYIHDTIVEVIIADSLFDLLVRQPYIYNSSSSEIAVGSYPMSNDGKSKFNNSYSEPLFMEAESQDTCFTDDWLWSIDFYIEEFIKGFGGPYYFTWSMGDFQMNRERALKYYKKNDVEWGTPFDLTVNIKQLKQKGSFNIYPIPAKDYVLIKRGDLEIKHVNIYDITGNLIKSFNFNKDADEIRLNISNFESGVYWVKIGDRIKKMVVY